MRILSITCVFILSGLITRVFCQDINRSIIADQFGYLPDDKKIVVIKDPRTGFDADEEFIPGNKYVVVNEETGQHIFRGQPVVWKSGAVDESSGDAVWHFDFSQVKAPGTYYILDSVNAVRSYTFEIDKLVYREVLKHAVRTFFYQRAGFVKEAKYAGEAWADGASHIGPLQDSQCRYYKSRSDASTERDLHGGWYDAGDYNKYTNWTADYVVEMMKAYQENPSAWGDDYNIPESGNGIPDLLDEAKWGLDFLLRMQQADGGVLSIVSESHASPPSSATGQSVYGPASTSATFNTAAAFAIASKVLRSMNMIAYSDTLKARAEKAWTWGVANPSVIFHNNTSANGSLGVGAGDQEVDPYGLEMAKLEAACFLFEVTEKNLYHTYFKENYSISHLLDWTFAYPYEAANQELMLYYTRLPKANSTISQQILNVYKNAMMTNEENFPAFDAFKDPYMAHLKEYTWGSNNQKGAQGTMYYNMIYYSVDASRYNDARDAALGFIHYIHGVNPLNFVYLSNMYNYGADYGVNEFYHSWFTNGSTKWDRVGTSLYGPAPGFVTGGANPGYERDGCCETGECGSSNNLCDSEILTPPKGQPKQKSYKDFNTSWPLNSWSVTENSCGYQVSYLKLLSKFVNLYDCHGDSAGTAAFDLCGICSAGETEREPETELCNCPGSVKKSILAVNACEPYTSPSGKYVWETSGSYPDTITAANGCDSIITVNLNIQALSFVVTSVNNSLIANSGNQDTQFQWLQCDNNFTPVTNAVNETFIPTTTGSYAVEATLLTCKDTSACQTITVTSTATVNHGETILIYPNPARYDVSITLPAEYPLVEVEIKNTTGKTLEKEIFQNKQSFKIPLSVSPGLYIINVTLNGETNLSEKLVIE